jgi:hypothetical protein
MILRCDCGEYHPSALTKRFDNPSTNAQGSTGYKYVCGNCYARTRGWPKIELCVCCEQQQPCDKHHVHGWRVSHVKEFRCVNCHRKLHRGRAI